MKFLGEREKGAEVTKFHGDAGGASHDAQAVLDGKRRSLHTAPMKLSHRLLTWFLFAPAVFAVAEEPGKKPAPGVSRKPLLALELPAAREVARVEAQEIELATGVAAPRHDHPCPVVGRVESGELLFQIEGQPPRRLVAGQAFFEPANTPVIHFDNAGSVPLRFSAFYLLAAKDRETIRLLPHH